MSRILDFFRLGSRPSRNGTAPPPVVVTAGAPGPTGDLVPTAHAKGPIPLDQFPDRLTVEDAGVRTRYREMMRSPWVKSAVLQKVLGVAQLKLRVKPADPDDERDAEVAELNAYSLTKCGVRPIVEAILFGALIDGYGVCHKKWRDEDRGKWAGKRVLAELKPKDSEFVKPQYDRYRNLIGLQQLIGDEDDDRADGFGRRTSAPPPLLDPKDFVFVRHLPIFDAPQGMSDLRAADQGYCGLEILQLLRTEYREIVGKGPFLVVEGVPGGDTPQLARDRAILTVKMAAARSGGFLHLTGEMQAKVLSLAVGPEAEFQNACREFREEISTAITGAYLQAMAGGPDQERGNSTVAATLVESGVWYLAQLAADAINRQIIPECTDLNFAGRPAFPEAELHGTNPAFQKQNLELLTMVQAAGVDTSAEQWREEAGARAPKDAADTVPGKSAPAPGAGPGADPFGGGGEGDDEFGDFDLEPGDEDVVPEEEEVA